LLTILKYGILSEVTFGTVTPKDKRQQAAVELFQFKDIHGDFHLDI